MSYVTIPMFVEMRVRKHQQQLTQIHVWVRRRQMLKVDYLRIHYSGFPMINRIIETCMCMLNRFALFSIYTQTESVDLRSKPPSL